ncbi:MAG: hypothetical protein MUP67_13355, partial [Acidimicrobiia bacterium]|nr:hypothetical protein [Acidimicrobiia bacterium]
MPAVVPRDCGLLGKKLRVDALDRFADLDQPDPHRVEDQTVIETASPHVCCDRRCRYENVLEPLSVVSAHSGIASAITCCCNTGFNATAGTT